MCTRGLGRDDTAVCTRGLGPEGTALCICGLGLEGTAVCTRGLVPRGRLASSFLTSVPCFHTGRSQTSSASPVSGTASSWGGGPFPHSTGQPGFQSQKRWPHPSPAGLAGGSQMASAASKEAVPCCGPRRSLPPHQPAPRVKLCSRCTRTLLGESHF